MPKKTDLATYINLSDEPIFFLSSDFIVLDLNITAEKIFKIKKESIIGRPFSLACPDFDMKTLEQFGNFTSNIRETALLWRYFILKNSKDGNNFFLIGSINNQKNELPSNQKKIDGSTHEESINLNQFLTGQLVDKRKNPLDHVKDIYAYMENIIAEMPVSVYWINKDFVYLGCNNNMAKLLNLKSRHDIIGKTYADLYDEKSSSHYRKADSAVMEAGIPLSIEEPLYYPDGSKETYLSNKVPLHNSEGKIIGMVGISVDITERKKMEEELHQAKRAAEAANHAKTEFIANMSHDIRTPLVGMLGMSKMLEDKAADPEQKQYAHWLGESGTQLLDMLNGVLDVISADNIHESDLHESPFSLQRIIQNIIQLERPSTAIKGIDLIASVDEGIPSCLIADHTKIHRVLLNLLSNAIKFTKEGKVELIVKLLENSKNSACIHFCIKDTGIGIPKDMQDSVFDRFYRATPSYRGTYTGHGIGLHIAQTFVSLLGGTIQLTSTPDVGTSFYFDLSLKIGREELLSASDIHSPVATPATNSTSDTFVTTISNTEISPHAPSVLLIEDNKIALLTLESNISKMGWRFTSVTDGEPGLDLATTEAFDLIISDVGLPKLSGMDFTRRLRAFEQENQKLPVPVIGLTAHAQADVKKECLESGMNEAYTKPMTPEVLEKIGRTWLKDKHDSLTFDELSAPKSLNGTGKLGPDLPDTEEELFALHTLTLFDSSNALPAMGNDLELFKNILTSMVEEETPADLLELEKAHRKEDWASIEKLAHRMKGGLVYCGTVRWARACQYLERYYKAGHRQSLEPLYQQLRAVAYETSTVIREWLASH